MTPTSLKTTQYYKWHHQGRNFQIAYETRGEGSPLLLLPAFSTVSTRQEMLGLTESLASDFQAVTLDWLGFGDSDRPNVNYGRLLYEELLKDFIQDTFSEPVAIVAAGHAAGYTMQVAYSHPALFSKMLLIAPTWKGPLRVMGAPTVVAQGVRNLVKLPLIGQVLYGLNTTPAFLKFMYKRHVYTDINHLTPEFIAEKHQLTQQLGGRFAPATFVTGGLDPMTSHEEFLQVAQALTLPIKIIIGEQSPPQSKAEMEALAALPNIESAHLPGSLGMHEEYASPVAKIAKSFVGEN
ncbi:MAG: alpha/beta fold hydrolase [Halothece sp. Uz-M2-17]|nr:alpha/beta fold hydrolase [Halothece sp. Uz-M2-17]